MDVGRPIQLAGYTYSMNYMVNENNSVWLSQLYWHKQWNTTDLNNSQILHNYFHYWITLQMTNSDSNSSTCVQFHTTRRDHHETSRTSFEQLPPPSCARPEIRPDAVDWSTQTQRTPQRPITTHVIRIMCSLSKLSTHFRASQAQHVMQLLAHTLHSLWEHSKESQ